MIKVTSKQYETEDEDWAFSDGVKAGVKAMCKKYNIDENDVYKKDDTIVANCENNSQGEKARNRKVDTASNEVRYNALKSKSNKRDGNPDTFSALNEIKKGCGKYETRGAYTFTCGESSRAGKIQLCKECNSSAESEPKPIRCNGLIYPKDEMKKEIDKGYEDDLKELVKTGEELSDKIYTSSKEVVTK